MRRNRKFAPSLFSLDARKLPSDLMAIAIAIGNPMVPPSDSPTPTSPSPSSVSTIDAIPLYFPGPASYVPGATS